MINNFIEIDGSRVIPGPNKPVMKKYYFDISYITIIEKPLWKHESYSIKVNDEWIYSISDGDMDRIVCLSKSMNRDKKIDDIIN